MGYNVEIIAFLTNKKNIYVYILLKYLLRKVQILSLKLLKVHRFHNGKVDLFQIFGIATEQ